MKGLLSYNDHELSRRRPFLLLDYRPPCDYAQPTGRGGWACTAAWVRDRHAGLRGQRRAPRRTGSGGVIDRGDVQWMTAASGILHEEYHEAEWAKRGGPFQMAQFWVNLPAAHKMDAPGYQGLTADDIASVELPDGAGTVRVIAGTFDGARARPARSRRSTSGTCGSGRPIGRPAVRRHAQRGRARDRRLGLLGGQHAADGELVVFESDGEVVSVTSDDGARFLFLNGEPIDEPSSATGRS